MKTKLIAANEFIKTIGKLEGLEVNKDKYVRYEDILSNIENCSEEVKESKMSQFNEDIEVSEVRRSFKPLNVALFALIPFSLYLLICIFTQALTLNIEMLSGGIVRIASGGFALFGIEFLSVFAFYKLFFRLFYIRFLPNVSENNPKLDFLTEYLELESWKRVLLDFFVLFGFLFLLAFNMWIVSNLPTMGSATTGL